jgi:Fe-S oxidoreductase
MSVTPFMEVNQAIVATGGDTLNNCMQCGLCAGLCPWGRVVEGSPFVVRKLIRMGQLGLEGFESDDILYACTTCNLCVKNCPRQVKIIDVIWAMRSMIAETGAIPQNLRPILGSVHSNGNPWNEDRAKRINWTQGLDVPAFGPDTEYFLFVCCTSAFDQRSQKIARTIVELLTAAKVSFGIIGNEESCCGESVGKIGDENLFTKLAKQNLALYQEKGVKKIITTSPHCYTTFTKDYKELGAEFEVQHYSQVLNQLIQEGRLTPKNPLGKKVVYHDPCYLGRHNDLYEAPRSLLQSIPELELMEFTQNKAFSLCCGGGGGRLWMETKPEQRFSDKKMVEAADRGAQVLATACPYCISLFEDSRKGTGKEDQIEVKDLTELLHASL